MAEQSEQTRKVSSTKFRERLDIYIDSLERSGETPDGRPVFRFKPGVTKESLAKAMDVSESTLNTQLPKIKNFLHYGSTLFEYKGREMYGVQQGADDEPNLKNELHKSVGPFVSYCKEEFKKPANERAFTVKKEGVEFPDFSGGRMRTIEKVGSVFSKLQGLAGGEKADDTPDEAATEKAEASKDAE